MVGVWGELWGGRGGVICFWVSRKYSLSPVVDGNSLSVCLHLICVLVAESERRGGAGGGGSGGGANQVLH